ncbi:ABC transporter permease [Streptomyces sp. NPDC127079]|uniref:ABC transporter permease n=1 Tax=Streptomyces sp. NPDC127079 TaxID=3347132 RepID=UPI0036641C17
MATDTRILWRAKTPLVFMFAVPALLGGLLGSAFSSGPGGFPGRSVVGFGVLFSFMTINYIGMALFREFIEHTWTRQATYRVSKPAFLVGKLIPVVVIGLLQLLAFCLATLLIYDIPPRSVAQLVVISVALAFCGPLLGIVLYNATSSASTFQSVTYLTLLGMGGAGGAIAPTGSLPLVVQYVGTITPHHWAMAAFTNAMIGDGSWRTTGLDVAVIVGMNLVLAAVAVRTFDARDEKQPFA